MLVYIIIMMIIMIIIFIFIINKVLYQNYENMINIRNKPIYCLMITGKDNERYKFARISIINFLLQTYDNKYLIIINHGSERLDNGNVDGRIKEIMISKKDRTLGDLRNISLSYVPDGEIFTTWDDDDWRSENYLQSLYNILIKNKAEMVMIRNRIEYNLNNKSIWKSSLRTGFPIFFMIKDNDVKYDSYDTLEDQIIKIKSYKMHKRIIVYDNDARLYIRYIHKNNTSPYVNKDRVMNNDYHHNHYENYDYIESVLDKDEMSYSLYVYNVMYASIIES